MPKVSIIIPAYNCERYIATAIESVLSQDYRDFELIVVDDGSSDNTAGVISRFSSRLKYIRQPNTGPAGARNTGILNAKGDYLAFLDQDDAWFPEKLRLQVEALDANSKLGLVYSDTYILNDGDFAVARPGSLRNFQLRQPYRGKVAAKLLLNNFIATSSVMVRKTCLERVGMFNGRITPIEDYDRWLRIAILYEVDYVDRPLVRFRDHVACFRKDKVVTIQNIINTLNGIFNEYPQMRLTEKEKIDRKLSCLYVDLSKAYLWRFGLRQAFLSCSSACKLTKAPLLPFYVLFSFFVDYLKQPLRFLRLKFKRILAGH